MSAKLDSLLLQGEKILHIGHVSLWTQVPQMLLTLALPVLSLVLLAYVPSLTWHWVAAGFGMGAFMALMVYLRYVTTELAFTNKRVISKSGLISYSLVDISLARVESIVVQQSILGRIFNYGSLVISGTGTSHAPIVGIADPLAFRNAFTEAQEILAAQRR